MDVTPDQVRRVGAALHELASSVRSAVRGDLAGPADPAWSAETALSAQAAAWEEYLQGLATRLADAGDRLVLAADGYTVADRPW
jgi:hypothetical protein